MTTITTYDHAREAALRFFEMRAAFLAAGVSGRQLYLHINKELKPWLTNPIALWRDLEELIPHFDHKCRQDAPCTDFIDGFKARYPQVEAITRSASESDPGLNRPREPTRASS